MLVLGAILRDVNVAEQIFDALITWDLNWQPQRLQGLSQILPTISTTASYLEI
jgi:hypothetical protein